MLSRCKVLASRPKVPGSNPAEADNFSGIKSAELKSAGRDFKLIENLKPKKQASEKNSFAVFTS